MYAALYGLLDLFHWDKLQISTYRLTKEHFSEFFFVYAINFFYTWFLRRNLVLSSVFLLSFSNFRLYDNLVVVKWGNQKSTPKVQILLDTLISHKNGRNRKILSRPNGRANGAMSARGPPADDGHLLDEEHDMPRKWQIVYKETASS